MKADPLSAYVCPSFSLAVHPGTFVDHDIQTWCVRSRKRSWSKPRMIRHEELRCAIWLLLRPRQKGRLGKPIVAVILTSCKRESQIERSHNQGVIVCTLLVARPGCGSIRDAGLHRDRRRLIASVADHQPARLSQSRMTTSHNSVAMRPLPRVFGLPQPVWAVFICSGPCVVACRAVQSSSGQGVD